jgi:hypothetical protein
MRTVDAAARNASAHAGRAEPTVELGEDRVGLELAGVALAVHE